MGCDLVGYIVSDDGLYSERFDIERNYDLFSLLTGCVRGSFEPVIQPKGIWRYDSPVYNTYMWEVVKDQLDKDLKTIDVEHARIELNRFSEIVKCHPDGSWHYITQPGCFGASWLYKYELAAVMAAALDKDVDASSFDPLWYRLSKNLNEIFVFWLNS